MKKILGRAACCAALTWAGSASSATITWTDWTTTGSANGVVTATGTLTIGSQVVGVTYTGDVLFLQNGVDGNTTNYFNPATPYLSTTVENAPTAAEMIASSTASVHTLTFSRAVSGLVMAVVSVNAGNQYQFDRDFNVLSFGTGYWGGGTIGKSTPSAGVYSMDTSGEAHGVIGFSGDVTTLSWTSTVAENWNGFTFGVQGLGGGTPAVPEPSSIVMGSLAALGLGVVVRRRAR